jgi:maltoporin
MIRFKKTLATALIGGLLLSNINALELKSGYVKSGLDWTGLTSSKKDYSRLGSNSDNLSRQIALDGSLFQVLNPTYKNYSVLLGQKLWEENDISVDINVSVASTFQDNMIGEYPFGGYASFNNTLGFNESIWVGRREYQKSTIEMMDFDYLNLAGDGVGVENMKVMDLGNVSVAFLQNRKFFANSIAENNNIDARFKTNELGSIGMLEVGITYGTARALKSQNFSQDEVSDKILKNATTQGVLLQLGLHSENQDKTMTNKLVGMYGKNMSQYLYTVDFMDLYLQSDVGYNYFSLLNFGNISLSDSIDLGYALGYLGYFQDKAAKNKVNNRYVGNNSSSNKFFIGVRPAYNWNEFHTTLLELGLNYTYSYEEDLNYISGEKQAELTGHKTNLKATLAQQINIPKLKSKEFGNAAIRLYATTALEGINTEEKFVASDTKTKVKTKSSVGVAAVGVHFEWRK